ncbi:hypothetical protein ID866_2482 [Astraeus odoratus]|nr:hypothetical protein ID866_2482 [Astraeus odoratus]
MSPSASRYRLLGDAGVYPYGTSLTDGNTEDPDAVFGSPERRREVEEGLLRKLDLRVAFLVLVYIMNLMDRSNVAAARLKGLEEDLHMTGQQFNTLVGILSVGYVLMQIPSYKRDELGLRMAYFTCGSSISNAFGSLAASGILAVTDRILGYAAWRWLFFIEGSFTCIIAIVAFYVVPDFPTTPASWLTIEEQVLAQKRMEEDICSVEQDGTKSIEGNGLMEALADWRVWWLAITTTILFATQSYTNFFPTLAATMGYDPTITLLLCAPPWLVATATSFFVVRHSDATRNRFWHIAGPISMGILGFMMAILTMNTAIRYVSLFFMTQSLVAYIVLLAWISNSILEPPKRAVAIAFANTSAHFGNIGTSYLWPAAWGPSYARSYMICLWASVVSMSMLWVYRTHLKRLNEELEANERILGLPAGFRFIT